MRVEVVQQELDDVIHEPVEVAHEPVEDLHEPIEDVHKDDIVQQDVRIVVHLDDVVDLAFALAFALSFSSALALVLISSRRGSSRRD